MSRKKEKQTPFVYEYIEKGMKTNRQQREVKPTLNKPTKGWNK